MDLSSASNYLNNILAKAGLLKGGTNVPFHNPSSEDGSVTRIINLVHDLVTRREKEEEQLENLANTIRQLRGENAKLQQANDKLDTKCEDLEKHKAMLEGQQKAFNTTLRTSEAAAKSLRDETTRLKMVLQQLRNQFANDIRKRDVQLEKIKEQLLHPRRNPRNVNTITITGTIPPAAADAGPQLLCGPECIAQDTADALTELSQTLANENDNLVSITRQTLSTLNSIQGIKDDFQFPPEQDPNDSYLAVCPQSFDILSEELQRSMTSLRDMLNQPNYVALEELQERDKTIEDKEKEISKLQARIVVVEEEWRKSIEMVNMWVHRVNSSLLSRAVAPVDAPQERTAGLEQILEEEEEEEEEQMVEEEVEIMIEEEEEQVYSAGQYADNYDHAEDVHPGDVSLDEEQLRREATMIGDEDDEEEGEGKGDLEDMEDMLDEYDMNDGEERGVGDSEEPVEEQVVGEKSALGEEVPGDEELQMDEQPEDTNLQEEDVELPEELVKTPNISATPNPKFPDSTPPPTSPQKAPPHRARKTPSKKTFTLDENISPSPLKLKNTPSRRAPNPKKLPKKIQGTASSPIHTGANRFLSEIFLTETSPAPKETPKASPKKKSTKRAHFESPIVQDTPALSTPKRGKNATSEPLLDFLNLGGVDLEDLNTPELNTPRRTTRTSKKRVLLDTPEQAPSNVSKRRKTPAAKKRSRSKTLDEDNVEDFSR